MNYRALGNTGLTVSEIGFGGWGIGGGAEGNAAYGPVDESESRLALKLAFDLGVTFYDTSPLYGFGRSEELIGEVLQSARRQIVIGTKVGLLDAKGTYDFTPSHIRRSLEESLRRLKTDYVDLFQLHSPSLDIFIQDPTIPGLLESLRKEGKIRAFGISVRSPVDGLQAIRQYAFNAVQVNFNLLDQRAVESGFFDLCRERNVAAIARTPLCFGFLSGRYSADSVFHPLDHRQKWSKAQKKCWAKAFELFQGVLQARGQQTQIHMALRFCLSYPCVSTVIPGMLTQLQVKENVMASDFGPFSEEEKQKCQEIYQQNTFFVK